MKQRLLESNKENHWKRTQGQKNEPLRDSNNKRVHNDNEKAETMNKFFSTIGQELSSNFKTLDHAVNIPYITIDTCIADIHISEDKFNDKFRK